MSNENQKAEYTHGRAPGCTLFVGNLPFQAPWQSIKDHFRAAGTVRFTDLIADQSGRSKGSALVTMIDAPSAKRAIEMLNEVEFEGRRLIVRQFEDGPRPQFVQQNMLPAYNRGSNGVDRHPAPVSAMSYPAGAGKGKDLPKPRSLQDDSNRRLFVSNLPFDCTSQVLRDTFQQTGCVESAEIIVGRNGRSRGMGIVVMRTADEAQNAISEFHGIEMIGRPMTVRLDKKI